MQLQSKGLATLIVDGRDIGWFATKSGGAVTGETVADRSPGDRFPTKAGGESTIEPVTLTRRKTLGRDTSELRRFLSARVNKTNAATVGDKETDGDGNPIADGDTYLGTITSVDWGEMDLNSSNQPKVITIIIDPSNVT